MSTVIRGGYPLELDVPGTPVYVTDLKFPGTVSQQLPGDAVWVNPDNVKLADLIYATCEPPAQWTTTYQLVATNYNVNLPVGAIPIGVIALPVIRANSTKRFDTELVSLCWAGTLSGQNLSVSEGWPNNPAQFQYGVYNYNWGWDHAQPFDRATINSSNFGYVMSAIRTSSTAGTAYIDHMALQVCYRF